MVLCAIVIERPEPSGRFGPRASLVRSLPKDLPVEAEDSEGDPEPEAPGSLVMYDSGGVPPPGVARWDGWPVEWATPSWGSTVGLTEITKRSSTVFAAIDKNAWALATMPPYLLVDGKISPSRPDWMTNPQPGVYTGWIDAMRQVVASFYGGEVFLWCTSRNRDGTVRTWVMLDPGWVNVLADGEMRAITLHGQDITADVLHVKYASWPGEARGVGPLAAGAQAMFGAAALERYQADLASRGGIPWGVITVPGRMTADQANNARLQYVEARMGSRAAPAVFTDGATLSTLNISPKDMALLELRQFDEARLAVLLSCPPSLLGLPSGENSLTYQTQEGIYGAHWRTGLRPSSALLSEAISNWALRPGETMEVDDDEYTRPALKDYAATLVQLVEAKIMTVDEARAALRFNSMSNAGTSLSVGVA